MSIRSLIHFSFLQNNLFIELRRAFYIGGIFFLFFASFSLAMPTDKPEEPIPSSSYIRKNYPKSFAEFLYSSSANLVKNVLSTKKMEYAPNENLGNIALRPRFFLTPPVFVGVFGLFLGHTFSSIVEISRGIKDLEKEFYNEKKINEKVVQASRANQITFDTWVSDPSRKKHLLEENYLNIHERLLCMVNLESLLDSRLDQALISKDENLFLKIIRNLTNPMLRYVASPVLEKGKRLHESIGKEKDHLTISDNLNYLLSSKHYLLDAALDDTIKAISSYFNKYLSEGKGKIEELEEFNAVVLETCNLLGVVWGKKSVSTTNETLAKEFCAKSLSVFDLLLVFDEREKVKLPRRPEINCNKGLLQYKYMGNLTEGLENLEEARTGFPYDPNITSNIVFCKYLSLSEQKDKNIIPELMTYLSALNEAIDLEPKNAFSHIIRGTILLKIAVLQHEANQKKSIEYAKRSKEEFDNIEKMRKTGEISNFEPDEAYYYQKGQAEVAIGDDKSALESLRKALSYSNHKKTNNNKNISCEIKSIKTIIDALEKKLDEEENQWVPRNLLWGSDQNKAMKIHKKFLLSNINLNHFTQADQKEITDARDRILNNFRLKIFSSSKVEGIELLLESLLDLSQNNCIPLENERE